jgi:hypothetical protein
MALSEEFSAAVSTMPEKLERLLNVAPQCIRTGLHGTEKSGVYLFTEKGVHLYVGRTKNFLADRVRQHVSTAEDCPFAFRLAREETNNKQAIYKGDGTRKWLLANEAFKKSYGTAKLRIREMDVRWISEPDNLKQTLLEIYVAVTLKTPYNDLETH